MMYALYLLFMVIYNAALIGSNTYKMCDQSPIYCLAENVVPFGTYSVQTVQSTWECLNRCKKDDDCRTVGHIKKVNLF